MRFHLRKRTKPHIKKIVLAMEIKIKDKYKLIDAAIEVVDGVMIVSPKEEKVDITKFKDGDVITCGWDDGSKSYSWTGILRGEIESISDNMFIGDYCSLDCEGEFLDNNSGSDSATWVRYATEAEKKQLFDRLADEGYEFDFEKKKLVKLRWKPKHSEEYHYPFFDVFKFTSSLYVWDGEIFDDAMYDKGWVFRTKEECEQFCKKLNKAIEGIKP